MRKYSLCSGAWFSDEDFLSRPLPPQEVLKEGWREGGVSKKHPSQIHPKYPFNLFPPPIKTLSNYYFFTLDVTTALVYKSLRDISKPLSGIDGGETVQNPFQLIQY